MTQGIPERKVVLPSQRDREWTVPPGEEFLAGPVRWSWLERAQRAPGTAYSLWVSLHLLKLARMRKSSVLDIPAGDTARMLGMSRSSLDRALRALEDQGLVRLDRRQRQWPRIHLLGEPTPLRRGSKTGT